MNPNNRINNFFPLFTRKKGEDDKQYPTIPSFSTLFFISCINGYKVRLGIYSFTDMGRTGT